MRMLGVRKLVLVAAAAVVLASGVDGATTTATPSTTTESSSSSSGTTSTPSTTTKTPSTTTKTPSTTTATPSTTTATPTSTSSSPSTTSTTTTSTSAVTCKFRYSLPTASTVEGEVGTPATSTKDSTTTATSGSSATTGSTTITTNGSSTTDSTVIADSSSSGNSVDAGSGSTTSTTTTTTSPSTTTATPSTTTATPSSTTKTPSTTTTPTPTSTTKTPSSTTKTPSTTTATPSTTEDGSTSDSRRYLASTLNSVVSTVSAGETDSSSSTSADASSSSLEEEDATSLASSSSSFGVSSSSSSSFSSLSSSHSSSSSSSGQFNCDATFYGAWSKMGLTCNGVELDVNSAVAATECLIYSGYSSSTSITDMKTCLSACRFPSCNNGTWDYTAEDGIESDIYANLNFFQLMRYGGASDAIVDAVEEPFSNLTMTPDLECAYESDASFSTCSCNNLIISDTSSSSDSSSSTPSTISGGGTSDYWADGTAKTSVDKAGIATSVIGSSAATVSVAVGGIMTVAGGVVGGTSTGVATGVSAGASVGVTIAAVDICQFSIMVNQMNIDARPRFLEDMGRRMAPAGFQFLPFGKSSSSNSASSSRRLTGSASGSSGSSGSGSSDTTTVQGMEKYAEMIGVDTDMLFYMTCLGVLCFCIGLFVVYALVMGLCYSFVSDFGAFSRKWFDKTVGVLMMILILSEYVIGVTATFQFCYCVDNNRMDISLFLAIFALLFCALGTILFGVVVIKNHEHELRDLGTKDHFDKKVHARYGPLYDEYSYEGRFFFAPKLLLALLCGMTTGVVWMEGMWQIIVLVALHIVYLFYMEVKQPYPSQFLQKSTSFVIIIKISALFLSFFLISSATSFNADIPDDLREGVGFAIIGLQVLVLVCLMVRQCYIFYRTWKLKRQESANDEDAAKDASTVVTTNNRDGDNFFSLDHHNTRSQGSMAVLGDDTAMMYNQQHNQYQQQQPRLQDLQPHPSRRNNQSVVVHDGPGGYRSNEVDL